KKMRVVLLNVFTEIPESFWDLEKEQLYHRRLTEIRAWEMEMKKQIEAFMGESRKVLLDAGFSPDSVSVQKKKREAGIARDIINEAKRDYYAVAVGRRGTNKFKDFILGSIATKLLERVSFAPLLLVGKDATPEKVLIGLDGSENAMRAVDYVGSVLSGTDVKVRLIHALRGEFPAYVKEAKKEMSKVLDDAKRHLEISGFKPDQVSTKLVTEVGSRAGAIIDEARQGGFKTIVVGRRGRSHVKDFSMGRVCNKVVYLAKGLAVWVIN
ncbi:MAG: hypothetical protein AMK69_28470, partial [Nitrospira bacterium SG8_3]